MLAILADIDTPTPARPSRQWGERSGDCQLILADLNPHLESVWIGPFEKPVEFAKQLDGRVDREIGGRGRVCDQDPHKDWVDETPCQYQNVLR